jgi:hypothetical protein
MMASDEWNSTIARQEDGGLLCNGTLDPRRDGRGRPSAVSVSPSTRRHALRIRDVSAFRAAVGAAADPAVLPLVVETLKELAQLLGSLAGPEPEEPGGHPSPRKPEVSGNVFRREGDYWTIAWRGMVCRLRHVYGLHYIAQLLRHPGREFHVLDLVHAGCAGNARVRFGAGIEVLDPRAKSEYRRRLSELREEVDEAERLGDPARATRAAAERDLIAEQLAAAIGLGGRDRMAAAVAERARSTVTHGIRRALRRLRQVQPALADELGLRIKTGIYCVYVPDPVQPADWVL